MQELITSSVFSLTQLKQFLTQLTNDDYGASLSIYSGSSIGMHTRHILEFYDCLQKNIELGIINYDKRQRDLELQTNVQYATTYIDKISHWLETLDKDCLFELHGDYSEVDIATTVNSSLKRELIYLLEHTIHHLAILKMGCLVHYKHIATDENFGLAYSTIKFKQRVYSNLSTS